MDSCIIKQKERGDPCDTKLRLRKRKKTLAVSLKRFMEKKPLSKITVSEIIADCGVNRKTFYYHFEDIYALLK